jgi:membrane protein DedA with SNARE-associated domain
MLAPELTQFVAVYGIWLVAVFIALESIGVPLPAEAALMAAAFFAARTHELDIGYLIATGVMAALVGEVAGFWLGRAFGDRALARCGSRLGLTEPRLKLGRQLFVRYGRGFVFIARFLPVLRNVAAVLAGANGMTQRNFYPASGTAAAVWVICYGSATYAFGEAFTELASLAAIGFGLAAATIMLAVPALILRNEKRLLASTEQASCGMPA